MWWLNCDVLLILCLSEWNCSSLVYTYVTVLSTSAAYADCLFASYLPLWCNVSLAPALSISPSTSNLTQFISLSLSTLLPHHFSNAALEEHTSSHTNNGLLQPARCARGRQHHSGDRHSRKETRPFRSPQPDTHDIQWRSFVEHAPDLWPVDQGHRPGHRDHGYHGRHRIRRVHGETSA